MKKKKKVAVKQNNVETVERFEFWNLLFMTSTFFYAKYKNNTSHIMTASREKIKFKTQS